MGCGYVAVALCVRACVHACRAYGVQTRVGAGEMYELCILDTRNKHKRTHTHTYARTQIHRREQTHTKHYRSSSVAFGDNSAYSGHKYCSCFNTQARPDTQTDRLTHTQAARILRDNRLCVCFYGYKLTAVVVLVGVVGLACLSLVMYVS